MIDDASGPWTLFIEGTCTTIPDVKRLHLPGVVLKSPCPHCKTELVKDLSECCIASWDLIVYWYCDDCGTEWQHRLKMEIKLELDTNQRRPQEGDPS